MTLERGDWKGQGHIPVWQYEVRVLLYVNTCKNTPKKWWIFSFLSRHESLKCEDVGLIPRGIIPKTYKCVQLNSLVWDWVTIINYWPLVLTTVRCILIFFLQVMANSQKKNALKIMTRTQIIQKKSPKTWRLHDIILQTAVKMYLFLLNCIANPDIGCMALFVNVSSILIWLFFLAKVPVISRPLPFCAGNQTSCGGT